MKGVYCMAYSCNTWDDIQYQIAYLALNGLPWDYMRGNRLAPNDSFVCWNYVWGDPVDNPNTLSMLE